MPRTAVLGPRGESGRRCSLTTDLSRSSLRGCSACVMSALPRGARRKKAPFQRNCLPTERSTSTTSFFTALEPANSSPLKHIKDAPGSDLEAPWPLLYREGSRAPRRGSDSHMSSQPAAEQAFCCRVCETEKEEARQIERSLLPHGSLMGVGFEVASRFSSQADVGGDSADRFLLPNGLGELSVENFVGKELTAAMAAALVISMLWVANKTPEDRAWVPWLCRTSGCSCVLFQAAMPQRCRIQSGDSRVELLDGRAAFSMGRFRGPLPTTRLWRSFIGPVSGLVM